MEMSLGVCGRWEHDQGFVMSDNGLPLTLVAVDFSKYLGLVGGGSKCGGKLVKTGMDLTSSIMGIDVGGVLDVVLYSSTFGGIERCHKVEPGQG